MNYEDMKLPELKAEAKTRKIKGYSTMKKAELVFALIESDVKPAPKESMIDAIKAAIRTAREARSSKGRKAGYMSDLTPKMDARKKEFNYRLQRGSATARLTAKQARRVRKTENWERGTQPVSQ